MPEFNQNQEVQSDISPRNAMFRSFLVPGWGHHYANPGEWRTGMYYMALDAVLITSVSLLAVNSGLLNENMYTFARLHSGTDIEGRSREFQLAVGNYESLAAYNAFQERTFNWERMLSDDPENFWEWESQKSREEYLDIRSRRDKVNRQIPTVISLMVVNRLVSGLSSYITARNMDANVPEFSMRYEPNSQGSFTPVASLRFSF